MISDNPHPILLSAPSAVLLIFFMPSEVSNRPQRDLLIALADSVQEQLGSLVGVLRIDGASHPEVVQSFAITELPSFVLVRQGVELWRQQGLMDASTLVEQIRRLLTVLNWSGINCRPDGRLPRPMRLGEQSYNPDRYSPNHRKPLRSCCETAERLTRIMAGPG